MIPFNKPFMTGHEIENIKAALNHGHLCGNGPFTLRCQAWLETNLHAKRALLTHSCTAALEMAAILADIRPGDEVIMPSYTFPSTANAFVLQGGVPVFVDVKPDTLNIDETLIENAITSRTRAIVPVHYAGVGCEMSLIMDTARKHELLVIEDAAQGAMSAYRGRPLGSIGNMGCLSFHETKNINSGEGGALLVNDSHYIDRAEIIWEKGTNRSQFVRGQVDKYTWLDIGSSYLPAECVAAFLFAQLELTEVITQRRLAIWKEYHEAFETLERAGKVRRPVVPAECSHNAHMYYLLVPNKKFRQKLLSILDEDSIRLAPHYIPLHSSPAGSRYGRAIGDLPVTCDVSDRILRLPLWIGIEEHMGKVIDFTATAINKIIS